MRIPLLAALTAFATVATCSSMRKVEQPAKLPSPPAHALVWAMVSAEMSPECTTETERALEHLNALGADLAIITVEEMHPSFTEPRVGEVVIHAGIPQTYPRLVESYVWRAGNGVTVLRAEVVIGWCSASIIAHEVAHCLGMASMVDHELLLHPDSPWALDPADRPAP